MGTENDARPKNTQAWISSRAYGIENKVQEVQITEEKNNYIAIPIESDVNELEYFDHIDEFIMYLVVFLRKIRSQFSRSKKANKVFCSTT